MKKFFAFLVAIGISCTSIANEQNSNKNYSEFNLEDKIYSSEKFNSALTLALDERCARRCESSYYSCLQSGRKDCQADLSRCVNSCPSHN